MYYSCWRGRTIREGVLIEEGALTEVVRYIRIELLEKIFPLMCLKTRAFQSTLAILTHYDFFRNLRKIHRKLNFLMKGNASGKFLKTFRFPSNESEKMTFERKFWCPNFSTKFIIFPLENRHLLSKYLTLHSIFLRT